jgi:UDP:flavonoid glycosyltransferase YjiC (YdhE family)
VPGRRVAVLPIVAIGHANPLLAIVSALTGSTDVAEVRGFGPGELARSFCAAGASYVTVEPGPADLSACPPRERPRLVPSDLAVKSFLRPLATIERYLRLVREFAPHVVLYDVFCIQGAIAARALGVPSASLVTMPGYGSLSDEFVAEHCVSHPWLTDANARYRDLTGVDLLCEGYLPVLFPSPELSIVTSIASLSRPVDESRTPKLFWLLADYEKTCEYVGPCTSQVRAPPPLLDADTTRSVRQGRGDPTFPFWLLDAAKRDGRVIVLFSLGTVLTDFRYHVPVGGASHGRDFLLAMLRNLITALGDDPNVLVAASLGSRLPRNDEPCWPENFIVRNFLPQVEILDRYADVFITHHGMNSMTESILAGVPMVSLPGVGDQIWSAQAALAAGAAIALWDLHDPYQTCDPALLGVAVRRTVTEPGYRNACGRLSHDLHTAGGPARVVDLVVSLADDARSRCRPIQRFP